MRQAITHPECDHTSLASEFAALVAHLSDEECARLIRIAEQMQAKAVTYD